MAKRKSAKQLEEKEMVSKNLRILMENSHTRGLRTTKRIVRYGAASFGRNVWLSVAATLVMTITLVILLTTAIASAVLSATADTLHDKIDIVVYFTPGTDQDTLNKMSTTMRADSNVKDLYTNTSEDNYNAMLEDNKDNEELTAALDENLRKLMIEATQATMHIKVNDPNDLDSIKNIINTDETFLAHRDAKEAPSYDADSSQIETVNRWANIAQNSGIVLSIIFVAISILVIFNTIRMAIFSRREEIYMMKLVGADNHFIRGPFIIEAQICGFLSGVIAASIGFAGFSFLSPKLADYGITVDSITPIFNSPLILLFYLAMVIIGIIIGTLSARLAIRKYLH